MAQLGHVWTQVGHMRNLVLCGGIWPRSWAQHKPNMGNMASHETPSKPKNVGKSGKNASFQRVALSPQNWLGLNSWAQLGFGGPTCPKLGPKLRCLGPNWHPSWRQLVIDGFQIEAMRCAWKSKSILTCRNLRALAASSHQVGPNGDNMENLASNEAPSIAKKLGKYR